MKRHDRNNMDRNHFSPDERRRTVLFLGTEIEPAQFWILACFAIPPALAMRYGLFEYLGLGPLGTVVLAAPFLAAALALAFIRTTERYLYMVLAGRPQDLHGRRTVAHEEDESAWSRASDQDLPSRGM